MTERTGSNPPTPAQSNTKAREPVLQVKDLHTQFFTFDGVVKAVDGIDFSIQEGETFGLVGESGCGKSVTALSILQLLQKPQGRIVQGHILLDGEDLLEYSEPRMREIRGDRISMIFQEPMTSLNPVLRIGDQLAECIMLHQQATRKDALSHAVQMLRTVGIADPDRRISEYPHQLSGGMRQRVMIAMALSCNPRLLIADEPTTALDVTIEAQILELMNRLKQDFDAAVLLITHNLGVIAETARSVAVMYAGRIVEAAEVVELFQDPRHPYTVGLMASLPRMSRPSKDKTLKAIRGIVPNLLDLPPGCRFCERCDLAFDRCAVEEPPLFQTGDHHHVRCWRHETG